MDIEKLQAAKSELAATAAYQTVTAFFDEGSFCEIDAFAKSGDGFAEVVAGFGMVDGMPIYAFAQNSDFCGGAFNSDEYRRKKQEQKNFPESVHKIPQFAV